MVDWPEIGLSWAQASIEADDWEKKKAKTHQPFGKKEGEVCATINYSGPIVYGTTDKVLLYTSCHACVVTKKPGFIIGHLHHRCPARLKRRDSWFTQAKDSSRHNAHAS